MYCSNCGAQIDDQSKFCDLCGAPVGVKADSQISSVTQPEISNKVDQEKKPFSGFCIAGFILPFLFFGAIGLPLSILGVVDCNKNGKRGKGLGIAGIVLSILNILETIIAVVFIYLLAMGMSPSPALYH